MLLLLASLLGQKHRLDVGQDTTLGDGDTLEKLVQLLVIADGQLQVTRVDAGLLVVTSGVASQLEDLSGEVFHDGGQIHRGTCTNALGIVAFAEHAMDSAHRELKTSTGTPALRLSLRLSALATT